MVFRNSNLSNDIPWNARYKLSKKLNNDNLLHNLITKILEIIPEKRISINETNKDSLIQQIKILYDKNIKHDLIIKIMFFGESL